MKGDDLSERKKHGAEEGKRRHCVPRTGLGQITFHKMKALLPRLLHEFYPDRLSGLMSIQIRIVVSVPY
jgi:hypothetical protein